MPESHPFPYLAKATLKYRSPHEQDLTFAKGETIRVLSTAPKRPDGDDDDDDDDWLVGQTLDGTRQGTFPAGFVAYEGPIVDDVQEAATEAVSAPISIESTEQPAPESVDAIAAQPTEEEEPSEEGLPVPVHASEPVPAPDAAPSSIPSSNSRPPPPLPDDIHAAVSQSDVALPIKATTDDDDVDDADVPLEPPPVVASAPVPASGGIGSPSPSRSTAAASRPGLAGGAGSTATTTTPPSAAAGAGAAVPAPPSSSKPTGPSSSFRNRIAAFNKPAAEAAGDGSGGGQPPPPIPRGKPGGWKRPPPPTDGSGAPPLLPGTKPAALLASRGFGGSGAPGVGAGGVGGSSVESPPIPSTKPEAASSESAADEGPSERKGFSAADAKSSITMSLRERMAALQRGSAAAAVAPPPSSSSSDASTGLAAAGGSAGYEGIAAGAEQGRPPAAGRPPVPGKLSAEKRNIAILDAGLGGAGPVAPAVPASTAAAAVADGAPIGSTGDKNAAARSESTTVDESGTTQAGAEAEGQEAQGARGADDEGPDQAGGETAATLTPEEEEAQRRAAIAQRMARLGGRRVGGGPALGGGMFGAAPVPVPAPPAPAKKLSTSSAVAVEEGVESGKAEDKAAPEPTAAAGTGGDSLSTSPAPAPSLAPESTATKQVEPEAISPSDGTAPAEIAETQPASVDGEPKQLLAVPRRAGPPRRTKKATSPNLAGAAVDSTVSPVDASAALPDAEPAPAADEAVPVQPEAVPEDASLNDAPQSEPNTVPAEAVQQSGDDAGTVDDAGQDAPAFEMVKSATLDPPEAGEESAVQRAEADEEPETPQATASGPELAAAGPEPEQATLDEAQDEGPAPIVEQRRGSIIPPRPSSIPPVPPVRPPSVPIPVTSPQPPAAHAPAPPISPAPPAPLTRPFVEEPEKDDIREAVGDGVSVGVNDAETGAPPAAAAPAGLVRPQAKMGVTVPLSDAEEAEHVADEREAHQRADLLAATAPEPEVGAELHEVAPTELTEEEQDAQRRAAIARRMAALGGQRMGGLPGMHAFGAPMPRRTTPQPSRSTGEDPTTEEGLRPAGAHAQRQGSRGGDDDEQEQEQGIGSILRKAAGASPVAGGVAIPGLVPAFVPTSNTIVQEPLAPAEDAEALPRPQQREQEEELGARLGSPPPVPRSPAPPLPRYASPAIPESASRGSALNVGSDTGSIGRPPSTRPVIPVGLPPPPPPPPAAAAPPPPPSHAADDDVDDYDQEAEDKDDEAGQDDRLPAEHTPPPAAPLSPARPPPPAKSPLRGVRSPPSSHPPPPPGTAAAAPPSQSHARREGGGIVSGKQNARDLDLMPSSRWWRSGLQNLPPSLSGRYDAITGVYERIVTQASGQIRHIVVIRLLFEDFSQTIVDLEFVDDDAEEAETNLSQHHLYPPVPPDAATLHQWHSTIGSAIAAQAEKLASSKNPQVVGDGSGYALPAALIAAAPRRALKPIGASFGELILHQAGPTILKHGVDGIRPGDIIVLFAAEFKGKKAALSTYHATYGSAQAPVYAVLLELETKKHKLRTLIQSGGSGGGKKGGGSNGLEEVSLRMDDLRAGVVKVFRVAPAEGWLEGW